jgi:hypothetical protein
MATRLTRPRRWRRRLVVVVVLALTSSFGVTALIPVSAAEDRPVEGRLRVIGELPAAVALGWGAHGQGDYLRDSEGKTEYPASKPLYGPRLLVDQRLNVGFGIGTRPKAEAPTVVMYDLERLEQVGNEVLAFQEKAAVGGKEAVAASHTTALDEVNHRLFLPGVFVFPSGSDRSLCPSAAGGYFCHRHRVGDHQLQLRSGCTA